MLRHSISLVIGASASALVFVIWVIPNTRMNWQSQGFNDGEILAKWSVAEQLAKEFPKLPTQCGNGRKLFDAKTSTVYVFDCPEGKQVYVQR